MNSRSKPKQFLELHGKPIIIYTLEHFECHKEVDQIIVVCLEEWIGEFRGMLKQYGITKVRKVIPGGETGHDSIYFGLQAMKESSKDEDVVLIHDGVRPLINGELITANIESVRAYGNGITCEAARETVVSSADGKSIMGVPDRDQMFTAKAPQSFRYGEIFRLYKRAQKDGIKTIDSAHLCSIYQVPMNIVESTRNNIKITQPADYYIFRALYEAQESQQIFGI